VAEPSKPNPSAEEASDNWPVGWDAHKRDQIIFIARNTTPAQRMKWLEDMLELLKPQLPALLENRKMLEAKRREIERAQRGGLD
jgi:hypothetical protein